MSTVIEGYIFFQKFKNTNCDFQQYLSRYKENTKGKKLIIPADKTTNFYRLDPASYKQFLKTNIMITKSYKKAPTNQTNKVIAEEKKIGKDLHIDNRIHSLAKKECFIILKDHKPNF